MITGYELTIEQTQKPQMTQELIQAIQILQFNNQELAEYIENELLENPILETIKDKSSEETVDIDELRERLLEINSDNLSMEYTDTWEQTGEEFSFERYVAFKHSLEEHLLSQLHFSDLDEDEFGVGRYLIQCIDENGYLTSSTEEIAEALNIDNDEVMLVLSVVQTFDPWGVGARNLAECLSIQLKLMGEDDENTYSVVNKHLGDLAVNKIGLIAKDMNIPVLEVQEIADKIKSLNPKPGKLFDSDSTVKYVIPDIYVDRDGDAYIARTNDSGTPSLTISQLYYDLREKESESDELKKYLLEKFNSAMWLIRSIDQRKSTIQKVATSIMEYQDDFFKKGTKYLRPLTLKQIAENVGVHESTVSRSINGKYIQCERGVFELKYFFSGGLKSDDGEDFSSNSVKEMIKEIIDTEDSSRPLSDLKIAEILSGQGIDISRRTVAKYREAMDINSSTGRKRY